MFLNPNKNLSQANLSDGMIVADFGAGTGGYALEAAKFVTDSGKVYAIDIQQGLLGRLAKEAKNIGIANIDYLWGDIEKENGTTVASESVDLVIIANTFFQIQDKVAAAREAARVLRKKGRVLFVEWSDSFAGLGPHRDHVFLKEDAVGFWQENGFVLDREIEAGDHHYGLILRKT